MELQTKTQRVYTLLCLVIQLEHTGVAMATKPWPANSFISQMKYLNARQTLYTICIHLFIFFCNHRIICLRQSEMRNLFIKNTIVNCGIFLLRLNRSPPPVT
jgi:hypothetical protein